MLNKRVHNVIDELVNFRDEITDLEGRELLGEVIRYLLLSDVYLKQRITMQDEQTTFDSSTPDNNFNRFEGVDFGMRNGKPFLGGTISSLPFGTGAVRGLASWFHARQMFFHSIAERMDHFIDSVESHEDGWEQFFLRTTHAASQWNDTEPRPVPSDPNSDPEKGGGVQ